MQSSIHGLENIRSDVKGAQPRLRIKDVRRCNELICLCRIQQFLQLPPQGLWPADRRANGHPVHLGSLHWIPSIINVIHRWL